MNKITKSISTNNSWNIGLHLKTSGKTKTKFEDTSWSHQITFHFRQHIESFFFLVIMT